MPSPHSPPRDARRFSVHAANEGHRHSHDVEGRSFEEAAIAFVEIWHPPVDAEGDVSVIVLDTESGAQQCFRIDMESGDAGPCE